MVTQKDQTATGDLGIFDMKTNTVTLTGDVVMTQGQNVLRGDRLVVDLTSGVSRVESGKNGRPGAGPVPARQRRPRSQAGRQWRAGPVADPGAAIQLTCKNSCSVETGRLGAGESANVARPAMADDRPGA